MGFVFILNFRRYTSMDLSLPALETSGKLFFELLTENIEKDSEESILI